MKKLLALLCLLLVFPAHAQVLQSGNVTPGHAAMWTAPSVIQDAGPATAGNLTELGITKNGGLPLCINTAAITGAYEEFCFTVNSSTGAFFTLQNFGGAAAMPLSATINGVTTVLFNSAGQFVAGGGGGGTPGGTNGQQQYNNAGSFGGFTMSGDMTVNTSTGLASLASTAVVPGSYTNTNITVDQMDDRTRHSSLPGPFVPSVKRNEYTRVVVTRIRAF